MADWYQQVTDVSESTPLDVPTGARQVLVQAEAQNVRWRQDGSDPTSTVGALLVAGTAPKLFVGALNLLRFIGTDDGAILNVHYR